MQIAPSPSDDPSLTATSATNNTSTTSEAAFLTFPSFSTKSLRIKTGTSDAQARQDRAAAIQNAKREVLANIRQDWTWPSPPPSYPQSDSFPRWRKSTRWREREYDSPPEATSLHSPTPPNPYRFESPDAVGAPPEPSKKRKLSNNEVEWNAGLEIFMARRDHWTGAERRPLLRKDSGGVKPRPSTTASSAPLETKARIRTQAATTPPLDPPTCTSSSHEETASTSPTSTDSFTAPSTLQASSSLQPSPTSPSSTQGCSSATNSDDIQETASADPEEDATMTLIPLAPPLLSPSDHPLLPTITPASYPTLYSKVIVQSLAPSVPINLAHVVGSLVQGWKEDGEWPPKSSYADEGNEKLEGAGGKKMGRKRREGSLRDKMKVLRI
ncbi:MAG: hypothetical protein Q9212_005264, partial [Teloschistes hypoglaucus]